jgi:hypothetical protein
MQAGAAAKEFVKAFLFTPALWLGYAFLMLSLLPMGGAFLLGVKISREYFYLFPIPFALAMILLTLHFRKKHPTLTLFTGKKEIISSGSRAMRAGAFLFECLFTGMLGCGLAFAGLAHFLAVSGLAPPEIGGEWRIFLTTGLACGFSAAADGIINGIKRPWLRRTLNAGCWIFILALIASGFLLGPPP